MKNYHEIGKAFRLTIANTEVWRIVAVECETIQDKQGNEYRKTCMGCVFAKKHSGICSGHIYSDIECQNGGAKNAKCSPEYREDGKFIHYKRIKTN